ncbi:hypothetical protein ACFQVB_40065 [Paraburkholderia humisilvae]|uniref:hypothetical protein n=2 Tax=Paraburkholderia humisilvae TaxID=627669 RepID=UPI003611771E
MADVMRVTTSCIRKLGNDHEGAVACLEALQRCRHPQTGATVFPETIPYNAAISACGKAARADDALRLFAHLQQHGPAHGVFPDTITYNAVISACGKAARADDALRLFAYLRQHGVERGVFPNTITYSAAISACEKAARADDALKLFAHLQQHGPARGVFPDAITYSAAISACEKAARADDALRLFAHLQQHGPARGVFPNTITYNAAISACEKAARADDALRLFAHLQQHGPTRGVFPDTITYNAAISACEKGTRTDDALSLFAHLQRYGPAHGVFPNTITYSATISACEKAARADDALQLFAHLQRHGPARDVFPDTITYNAAISACEKANRHREADRLLDDGITAGIFRPSLGFSAGQNMLDLHENAILASSTPSRRPAGVHPAVAQAIFNRLLRQGVIDRTTLFVVGQHGQGSLLAAIEANMRQQGWNPVHPRDAQGRPNRGCLVAATASVGADDTPVGRTSVLVPDGATVTGGHELQMPSPDTQTQRVQPVPDIRSAGDPAGAGGGGAITSSWADVARRAPAGRK